METGTQELAYVGIPHPSPYRILLVDDLPEIRLLVRARLDTVVDLEVIGEASNGREGVSLVRTLAPDLVILDLEMPVMTGEEAIPLMRELQPGMPIVLYTGTPAKAEDFVAEAAPDRFASLAEMDAAFAAWLPIRAPTPRHIVKKGEPLGALIAAARDLLARGSFDVLRLDLGTVPLQHAIAAFDTWAGVNVRILQALAEGQELPADPESPTADQLRALVGIFVHLGSCLRVAALADLEEVGLVVHTLRTTGAEARRGLLAIQSQGMTEFLASWDYEVPAAAAEALDLMWDRLAAALPVS